MKNQNKYTKDQWKEFHVQIDESIYQNSEEILILIEGFTGDNSNSLIAIDDINLYDGECFTTNGNISICDDGSTLNTKQICDFDNNCHDDGKNLLSADERSCGQCNFESGKYNIINSFKLIFDFRIMQMGKHNFN